MRENSGQVSLEYLMIFAISLIILIVFTLPLVEYSVESTLDVSDSLKIKSDLSNLASSISQVYGEGQGSKQTLNLHLKKSMKINVKNNQVSAKIKLKSGSNKIIKVNCKSNLKSQAINLKKGSNVLVVEWPVGSEKMMISSKVI